MPLSSPLIRGSLAALLLAGMLAVSVSASAEDWPQWRGPARDGVSRETGLLKSWPVGGPRVVWKATGLGGGYGGPSIAAGRIYGMGYRNGQESVWAREVRTGKEFWSTVIAEANEQVGYPDGSRCTPTVDGERTYVMGVSGDLVCLESGGGKVTWRKNMVTDFGGEIPRWGYSESPLIDGNRVIATPGGDQATLVAFNKSTGEVIWKAKVPGGDRAQYSSAIAFDLNGQRQYVQFLEGGVVGVSAAEGRFLWRYDRPANDTANISTPIYRDGQVFAASGYNTGGGLVRLKPRDGQVVPEEVFFTRQMRNHHGGVVLVGDYLYGFDEATLTCVDFKTGEVTWTNRSVGKGSLTYADGSLYVRSERGTTALVEANPKQYVERSRFDEGSRSGKNTWAHPVIANGRLYLRDQDTLTCYDVKGDSGQ